MEDDDLYELADEAPAKTSRAAPVQGGAGADAPRVAAPVRRIAYQSPSAIGTSESERVFADPVKDLYAPLIMIGGGLVIEAVAAYFRVDPFHRYFDLVREMGLRLCLSTGLMLAGIWIASRLRHFKLGSLPVAIMKLCAISIAPGAIVRLFWPLALFIPILGALTLGIVEFCLYFALIGAFFDLDQEDTRYCVCVIFVVSLSVAFGSMWLM